MASPVSGLRALLAVISKSIDTIEESCRARGLNFPSLDEPFTVESDAARTDPTVQEASTLIAAAAYQLVATVQQPHKTIFASTIMYYLPVSLRVATETNTVEILRDAGPEGLQVKDIAKKSRVDPQKLSRVLRYLATHHIFREVSPDVFANNRLSSICDTGKSVEDLIARPLEKHDNTSGIPALIGHCTDEDYKGAGYILEHLTDPETGFQEGQVRTPMMLAFGSKTDVWTWLEEPFNELRLRRFGVAMNGVSSMQSSDSILKGFDWSSLPEGSVVVDVGGGIGTSTLALARKYPALRYVIQDRPAVIVAGKKHCEIELPGALESGLVEYEEHNFFDIQPRQNAGAFLLKQITHDWSDAYAVKILRRLADAATPETKLVLVDNIIPYACPSGDLSIPGYREPDPPYPLLANLGGANTLPYGYDLSMYVHFNATERTSKQLVDLLARGGWSVVQVYMTDHLASYLPQVVASPAARRTTQGSQDV